GYRAIYRESDRRHFFGVEHLTDSILILTRCMDGKESHASFLVLFPELVYAGKSVHAWAAPDPPKIEKNNFASIILKLSDFAIGPLGYFPFRRWCSHSGLGRRSSPGFETLLHLFGSLDSSLARDCGGTNRQWFQTYFDRLRITLGPTIALQKTVSKGESG